MAAFKIPTTIPADLFSKEKPYYRKDIEGRIAPESRKLLEEYSHIKPEDVDAHLYKTRDLLWDAAPYPCIGEFKFVNINISKHPLFPSILASLQASTPSTGPFLLDLGCCVAQELRYLTHNGVPSTSLYGTDINPHFLSTSYTVFNDQSTFKATLIPADITSPTFFQEPSQFASLEGKFNYIFAGLFLHLFSRPQQLTVLSNVQKLLSRTPGSVFLGRAAGAKGGGLRGHTNSETTKTQFGEQFLHDDVTFKAIWDEVSESEGTKGQWDVWAVFKEQDEDDLEKRGHTFFRGPGIGGLMFGVTRV